VDEFLYAIDSVLTIPLSLIARNIETDKLMAEITMAIIGSISSIF